MPPKFNNCENGSGYDRNVVLMDRLDIYLIDACPIFAAARSVAVNSGSNVTNADVQRLKDNPKNCFRLFMIFSFP